MPSDDLPTLLGKVADAIRSDDFAAARRHLNQVEKVYKEIDTPERRKQRKSVIGRDSTNTDKDVRERLDEFAQAVNASDLGRSAMLTAVSIYLADPSQADPETIAAKVTQQAEQESTLVSLEAKVDETLKQVELPPVLLVAEATTPTGIQPKGTSFDIETTVQNVGDSRARGVSLEQESSAHISPNVVSLADLSAHSSERGVFTVAANQEGTFEVELRAHGDTARADTRTVRFRVVSKSTAIEQSQDVVADLIEHVEQSNTLRGGTAKAALAKLEAAKEKLRNALEAISDGDINRANNLLTAASRILGALINYIEGLASEAERGQSSKNSLSVSSRETLVNLSEGAIDKIALAQKAAA